MEAYWHHVMDWNPQVATILVGEFTPAPFFTTTFSWHHDLCLLLIQVTREMIWSIGKSKKKRQRLLQKSMISTSFTITWLHSATFKRLSWYGTADYAARDILKFRQRLTRGWNKVVVCWVFVSVAVYSKSCLSALDCLAATSMDVELAETPTSKQSRSRRLSVFTTPAPTGGDEMNSLISPQVVWFCLIIEPLNLVLLIYEMLLKWLLDKKF